MAHVLFDGYDADAYRPGELVRPWVKTPVDVSISVPPVRKSYYLTSPLESKRGFMHTPPLTSAARLGRRIHFYA